VAVADVGEPDLFRPSSVAVHDHRDVAGAVGRAKLAGQPALVKRVDEVLQPHKSGRLRPAPERKTYGLGQRVTLTFRRSRWRNRRSP
jgi:hypothetical protein